MESQAPRELQPEQQEEALVACYQESYGNGSKPKRILLPVRHLQQWIEHNILLELGIAPLSKEDAQLVPEDADALSGSAWDSANRTVVPGRIETAEAARLFLIS